MLSNLSSNVVLAKARAMYGRRLTPQSYQELLACRSVSEIAAYLKSHTSYGKILSVSMKTTSIGDVWRAFCASGCLKTALPFAVMRYR